MDTMDRTRILNMLKAGQISVEEAEQLLSALAQPAPAVPAAPFKDSRGRKGKQLHVIVDSNENNQKAKVNVHIPISLIRTIGPIIKSLPSEARAEMDKAGVDIETIMQAVEAALDNGIDEDIVNIDVGGDGPEASKVRVYVE